MDLVNRLKFFLETHQIAISQFADTCRIPRPTLSQILSGRNKKISDELITKIHNAYPELSVLWLMFGEGDMEVAENIKISEPQNSVKSPYPIAEPADPQIKTSGNSEGLPFTYSEANKFGDDNFGENLQNESTDTPQAHDMLANNPENSISFFVDYSGHESGVNADSSHDTSSATPESAVLQGAVSQPTTQTAPKAASAGNPTAGDANTAPGKPAADSPASRASIPLSGGGSISLQSPDGKKISNIVVFYSDNSFQSFSPTV